MTLDDYTVKDIDPDMIDAAFLGVLRDNQSPVPVDDARAVLAYCDERRLSRAFLLAMFHHESTYGRFGSAATTHSWGNTRPPSFGAEQTGVSARHFSEYAYWVDGGVSTAARLFDHAPYAGKTTVREIIPIWAPPSENSTARYIDAVLADIARWTAGGAMPVPKPPMDTARPSPNRGGYPGTRRVDAIIWHITQGSNSLGWLTNPSSGASSNYLIARGGRIHELVPPDQSAWANGRVCRPDQDHNQPVIATWIREGINFNQRTISIEHEGFSSEGRGGSLTPAQVDATVALTAWLCQEYNLAPVERHVFGHFEIDSCDRPNCPGFSGAEWLAWLARVRAALNVSEEGQVQEPVAGTAQSYINNAGQPITAIAWDGDAVKVDGTAYVDVGITCTNDKGEKYTRSIINGVMQPWVKVG